MFTICLVVIIVEEPSTKIEKYWNLSLQRKAFHFIIIIINNNDKHNSWVPELGPAYVKGHQHKNIKGDKLTYGHDFYTQAYKQQLEDNQNWIVKGLIKLVGIKET